MSCDPSFGRILKTSAPTLAALWVVTLLGAGATMFPTFRALSESWDDQLFEPGGLMLLESLRVHRTAFLSGLRTSLLQFAALQVLVLLVRARLTAVLVDASRGRVPRAALFSKTLSYLLVNLLKFATLGVGAAACAGILWKLPAFEGELPPSLLALYGSVLATCVSMMTWMACGFDLYKIGLFALPNWSERAHLAWTTLRRHTGSLLLRRAVWVFVSMSAGALTWRLAVRPVSEGFEGSLATFMLSQLLVVIVLTTEIWWIVHAEKCLRTDEGRQMAHAEPE